jgi:hypothetical protein
MVSQPCVSPRVLCACLWRCIIFHRLPPTRPVAAAAAPAAPQPMQPTPHRSHAPTPCAGLPHTPHGARCARDTGPPHAPPLVPPAPRPATQRRPRHSAPPRPVCPPAGCDSRGGRGVGQLRAPGARAPGPRVQATGWSLPGRLSPANPRRASASCGAGPAWLQAGGAAPPPASARSLPSRGCRGGPKRLRHGAPFLPLGSASATSRRATSTRGTRCGAPAKRVRALRLPPASVWSARPRGSGRPWPPRAHCWWGARWAAAPWRWRTASCLRCAAAWRPAVAHGCSPRAARPPAPRS